MKLRELLEKEEKWLAFGEDHAAQEDFPVIRNATKQQAEDAIFQSIKRVRSNYEVSEKEAPVKKTKDTADHIIYNLSFPNDPSDRDDIDYHLQRQ